MDISNLKYRYRLQDNVAHERQQKNLCIKKVVGMSDIVHLSFCTSVSYCPYANYPSITSGIMFAKKEKIDKNLSVMSHNSLLINYDIHFLSRRRWKKSKIKISPTNFHAAFTNKHRIVFKRLKPVPVPVVIFLSKDGACTNFLKISLRE